MIQIGFKCNKGLVRENNEDACFVIPSHDVYIVADGLGGNNFGEVASRTAVSEIAELVNDCNLDAFNSPEEIFGFFSEVIDYTNSKIYHMGIEDESKRGMATTLVMAYINGLEGYLSNVGDSRAYLLRDGEFRQLTVDHTYVNELIRKGLITEDQAETHKQRNVITKALGAEQSVGPDFYSISLCKDDVLMLCTDGLYGEVQESKIVEILQSGVNMNDACTMLVEEANKAGGRDNITVVCIKL
jgi:protein phosphatase